MCLGESTTQGQYPPFLEEILNQRNIGIKFSVIDKGIGGTNTEVILSELEANLDKYRPDMVVTMMGCNDGRGIMYYKDIPEANTMIFKHCRVYRFMRLIYMHILNKLKKEGIYGLNDSSLNRKTKSDSKGYKQDAGVKGFYQKNKEIEEEQVLKKAIELNPNDDSAYIKLGGLYKEQGKFAESEQTLKKAIELNPNNDYAYQELGWFYKDQGKFAESEQALKKAIELNPNNDSAYTGLAWLYKDFEKFAESEQAFKKAIELNPKNDSAYIKLGWLYMAQWKLAESEQAFKKAIELDPDNECLYGSLAIIYCDMGNNKLSKIYAEKANSLRDKYYNSITVNNYHMLKQILDKRKIKLVSVQYPMLNIGPLKKIFKEETEGSIIFVDNEKIFKDAIIKEGYREYFRDMFGGDFGHCTNKGNRLLAENIAQIILKEVFKK
jgi:tetratricopeptide (TPR) repeat protein